MDFSNSVFLFRLGARYGYNYYHNCSNYWYHGNHQHCISHHARTCYNHHGHYPTTSQEDYNCQDHPSATFPAPYDHREDDYKTTHDYHKEANDHHGYSTKKETSSCTHTRQET